VAETTRKSSGSYFTPPDLVSALLDSALDPLLDQCTTPAHVLAMTVCDPACGSGAFPVAAARRMADRLMILGYSDRDQALRDVIAACIYAVDLNAVAAEICKIVLWAECSGSKRPAPFLDHHIRSGNSLIGTTPALLAAGIPNTAFTALDGDDKTLAAQTKKKNTAERKKG
jgi:type II restriction/modification system DNA methylase subunit YeeA